MMEFLLTAPERSWSLTRDTDAILATSDVAYNASRETLQRLAKIRKFVVWLKAAMEKAGLPVKKGCFSTVKAGGGFSKSLPMKASSCALPPISMATGRVLACWLWNGGRCPGVDRAVELCRRG